MAVHQVLADVSETILPIVVSDLSRNPPKTVSFEGTGFLPASGLFVTCWHCVQAELPPRHTYAAVVFRGDSTVCYPLSHIERDANGSDIAIARIELTDLEGGL